MNDNSVDVLIKSKLGQYCPDGSSSNVISGGSRLAWPSDFIVCYSLPALSHRKQVFLSFNYMSAPKMCQLLRDVYSFREGGCMPPFRVHLHRAKANAESKFFLWNLFCSMVTLNWILYHPIWKLFYFRFHCNIDEPLFTPTSSEQKNDVVFRIVPNHFNILIDGKKNPFSFAHEWIVLQNGSFFTASHF